MRPIRADHVLRTEPPQRDILGDLALRERPLDARRGTDKPKVLSHAAEDITTVVWTKGARGPVGLTRGRVLLRILRGRRMQPCSGQKKARSV